MRGALKKDMDKHADAITEKRSAVEVCDYLFKITIICWSISLEYKQMRLHCQACVARSGSAEDLMLATKNLASAISDYRQAAKSVKGMCSKPKAKAKEAAAPAPST